MKQLIVIVMACVTAYCGSSSTRGRSVTLEQFVGKWVNEGEQVSLVIGTDNFCILSFMEMESGTTRQIMGRVEVLDRRVSIHWDGKWWYGTRTDFEYRVSGGQALLWMTGTDDPSVTIPPGGQFGFYRESNRE